MELSLERKPITVNETILDINTEQAVESDMLLADYYPRISRILRCCVETSVDQAVVSGERLIVDGVALCRVFYKSEEGRPASVTVKLPYTKAVELRRAPQKPQIAVQSYPGYFSCRAVNSGRLEIRGATGLRAAECSAGAVLSAADSCCGAVPAVSPPGAKSACRTGFPRMLPCSGRPPVWGTPPSRRWEESW